MMGEVVVRVVEKSQPLAVQRAEDRGQKMMNQLANFFQQNLVINFNPRDMPPNGNIIKLKGH